MRNIAFALIVLLAVACKTQAPVAVPVRTSTTVKARPIVFKAPQDHLTLNALFQCDSNNRVILGDYSELYSQYISLQSQFTPTSGGGISMNVSAQTNHPDTIYIVQDSTIYQDVPIYVDVPVQVVKPLSGLYKALLISGALLWALIVYRIYRIFKTKNTRT